MLTSNTIYTVIFLGVFIFAKSLYSDLEGEELLDFDKRSPIGGMLVSMLAALYFIRNNVLILIRPFVKSQKLKTRFYTDCTTFFLGPVKVRSNDETK